MSVSRDDFGIAFRSALLKRGGAQKFSVLSLIFLALAIMCSIRVIFPIFLISLFGSLVDFILAGKITKVFTIVFPLILEVYH